MDVAPGWETVRKVVLARDWCCVRCLGEPSDVHHRMVKGMGGTGDERRGFGPENLVALCRRCHDYVHAHPEESYTLGFLVHSWANPAEIPVTLKGGEKLVLFPDGTARHSGKSEPLF